MHTDHLGSLLALTTVAPAALLSSNPIWEPWGAPVGGGGLSGIQYADHYRDAATGLSYMQQRYYDPYAGRFLAVDPVAASAGSFNRYWYANNNPYKYTDPDGQAAIISKEKDGSISVEIPTKFVGPAASEGNIGKVKEIVSGLSGQYEIDGEMTQVNFKITDIDSAPSEARNIVALVDGSTHREDGISFVRGNWGEIDISDRFTKGGVPAHEFLHLAGAKDKYTPGSPPGWDGNIMKVVPGKMESKNFNEIIGSPKNIYKGWLGDE